MKIKNTKTSREQLKELKKELRVAAKQKGLFIVFLIAIVCILAAVSVFSCGMGFFGRHSSFGLIARMMICLVGGFVTFKVTSAVLVAVATAFGALDRREALEILDCWEKCKEIEKVYAVSDFVNGSEFLESSWDEDYKTLTIGVVNDHGKTQKTFKLPGQLIKRYAETNILDFTWIDNCICEIKRSVM